MGVMSRAFCLPKRVINVTTWSAQTSTRPPSHISCLLLQVLLVFFFLNHGVKGWRDGTRRKKGWSSLFILSCFSFFFSLSVTFSFFFRILRKKAKPRNNKEKTKQEELLSSFCLSTPQGKKKIKKKVGQTNGMLLMMWICLTTPRRYLCPILGWIYNYLKNIK